MHVIAFLGQHLGDAVSVVERKVDLPDVDVAEEGQLVALAVMAHPPPNPHADGREQGQDEDNS